MTSHLPDSAALLITRLARYIGKRQYTREIYELNIEYIFWLQQYLQKAC